MNIYQDNKFNQYSKYEQIKGQDPHNSNHTHNQNTFLPDTPKKKLNNTTNKATKVNRFVEIREEANNQKVSNISNSENKESVVEINQTELIKKDLLDWFSLDDEIIKLNKKMKELKNQKNNITKRIEEFMENNNIGDIHSQGQKLKYCVNETRKAHTKKSLQNTLGHFFNNGDTAQKAYEYIMDNREKTTRVRLKRTANKIHLKMK